MNTTHTTTVSFTLPGRAWHHMMDNTSWCDEAPGRRQAFTSAPSRKVGFGRQYTVTLPVEDAKDLRGYLVGLGEVLASMSAEERGGDSPAQAFDWAGRVKLEA